MRNSLVLLFQFVSLFLLAQSEFELTLKRDSAILSGTLLLPDKNPTEAVVLFFSGSGPTDRDGNSGPLYANNSLKMLANDFAESGIASLRFDKRGVGKSEWKGEENSINFNDFIDDGKAWLSMLKSDHDFKRIYAIGHSQGSLIGALISVDYAVDKFVSLAGVSRSADEVILSQLESQSLLLAKVAQPLLDSLKSGYLVKVPGLPLNSLFRESVQPFLMSWFSYSPEDAFSKLSKPVLIVNGTTDIQVPVSDAEQLHKFCSYSQLFIVDGMNHVLKDAPIDKLENLKVYSNPDKPLSEGLSERIITFLSAK